MSDDLKELAKEFRAQVGDLHDRLDKRLDSVDQRLTNMDATLVRNTVSLEYHVARTDALETRVEQVATEMKPLKAHIALWSGLGKFLTWGLGIASVVLGVLRALGKL